ncbi:MAG: c-type cytochrome [Inquilinus sp.]|uniref:cytochrome c n=1 Tax=Inquilinus sp. TaxID=1932117 RepID=UPI003F30C482
MIPRRGLITSLVAAAIAFCGAAPHTDLFAAQQSTEPGIEIIVGTGQLRFDRAQLLARSDAETIEVPNDVSYRTSMSYRAVPLAALLRGLDIPRDTVIEAVATDGFAAQLPFDLVVNTDPAAAVAWLAVELPASPWPSLPGKSVSAGPFYLVWTGAQAAMVRSEQWPYQMARLSTQPSPAARWPQLSVDPALSAGDPIRAGQVLFVTQCLACHKLDGAGSGVVGPDLNRPMNPTAYMSPAALHALIRDPASVRDWPARKMQGFAPEQLSDREIDQVVAYLRHMAERRGQ